MGSNIGPTRVYNIKRPMCMKCIYLQYETMVFALPRGSKIEERSRPKRLQDESGVQAPKNHEKVANMGVFAPACGSRKWVFGVKMHRTDLQKCDLRRGQEALFEKRVKNMTGGGKKDKKRGSWRM